MRHAASKHHLSHKREFSLSAITLTAGLIAFIAGVVHGGHLIATVLGVCTFLFGLYSQLVSATTTERWVNVIGIALAFVGAGLGLSHGGFRI
jgi:hypothetical protein